MTRIPSHIDKYEILEQIGSGGMGIIYKARHPTLGRPVVLKRLTLAEGEGAVARFRREARMMMGFRNDAIVDVHDHFCSGGAWYIVMEYVDGVSLDSLIRNKGAVPSEAALLIALESARALKYAHDKGVVHRDVKPSNILISRKGEVKLTDFGIAAARDEDSSTTLTAAGITLGTVAYMSPEQLESSRDVDKRADIYSLGVMLYEMVTGKTPFPGSITPQTVAMIQRGKYRPVRRANPRVLPLVHRIIRRTVRADARKRFQDLGELLRLLERGLRFTDSTAVQGALADYLAGKRPAAVTRRVGALVPAAAALVAALAAAAGGWLAWRGGVVHELLLHRSYGALTVVVEGDAASPPLASVLPQGGEAPAAVVTLARVGDRWQSPRLYVPAGPYRVAVQADGLLASHGLTVAPREVQRRSPATRDGAVVLLEASGELAAVRLPLAVRASVRDAVTGADLGALARIEVKIGDGWSPFAGETLSRLFTGSSYEFRFEADGYHPATQRVSAAPHQALLLLDAALTPLPAQLRVTTALAGVRLRIDGSSRYLSAERLPAWRRLAPLDTTPRELLLAPGAHRITAERAGMGSTTVDVSLESGERVSVTVEERNGRLALQRFP